MPFKVYPPLYHVWQSMRERCRNPNNRQYKDYGGRGITICPKWDSYAQWYADMGPRPSGNYSMDRVDNDGNYEPGNCRWASRRQQQRNQRVTRYITVDGVKHRAVDLSDVSGLKTDTITERAAKGLSLEAILDPKKLVYHPGLALGGKANGRRQQAKTHCPKGHSYENAIISKEGWRRCRACHNEKQRQRGRRLARERANVPGASGVV